MDGTTLGHFALLEKIGEGGMGQVYKAKDTRLERMVAIKLLPESKVADAERRARFVQEAKAASALNHPNIITIHEIGEQDGQSFIVMELIDGKALSDLIPRKGMRLTEALRIAAQVADALTAAHAAGIVHRDLKPGNIMVDAHGRVKVLDFGLAKLTAPAASAPGAEEATRTIAMEPPQTDAGVILGSVPYMSPEQAEGKPVDVRSDIFSFGAVLYEMITGQRAFHGESRASTLAAVVEKEPAAPSELAATTPPELERLIVRCLRKDVNRRSQNMADVKLALEELRDESESGKLVRPPAAQPAPAAARSWLWPAVAMAAVLVAVAVVSWTWFHRRAAAPPPAPELVRLSPDDDHNYLEPAISPDGKFVAYLSDRSGKREVWLQQANGGEPIQLTHAGGTVQSVSFFPDGTRLAYATSSAETRSGSIEVIPILGGQPRVLITGRQMFQSAVSPDGRQIAYFESVLSHPYSRLMVLSTDGGEPRELSNWAGLQASQIYIRSAAWTSDSRCLLIPGVKRADANLDEFEWFTLPVDGTSAWATGTRDAMRAAGLKFTVPAVMSGDLALFAGGKGERWNVWQIRLDPKTWRVRGAPRQLSFGTEYEMPATVSASGMLTVGADKFSTDLYLIPLSSDSGQATGAIRRLTHDGRYKIRWSAGGDPGSVYFQVQHVASGTWTGYAVDLVSGKQTLVAPGVSFKTNAVVSADGRQLAYYTADGGSYSIRIGEAGAAPAAARLVCKSCGTPVRFSADGRFLVVQPEAIVKPDPKAKYTLRLLDVATGKDRPWLEHPSDSIVSGGTFGENHAWFEITVRPVGPQRGTRKYLVPWREEPVPPAEWIEVKIPVRYANYAPAGNFFTFFQGDKLMAIHFDLQAHRVGEPYEVKFAPGYDVALKTEEDWGIRGPGLVLTRRETQSSVWLMKLPE